MLKAIVRDVSPKLAECNLTYLERGAIDAGKAQSEHAAYKRTLEAMGVRLISLPGGEHFPDGAFVEDLAVVVEEAVVVTRPGAESRRPETEGLADVLRAHRPVHEMSAPATLDGGDVLRVDQTLFVGRSARTNDEGIRQLSDFLSPHGYRVRPVPVRNCLHLKTACSTLGGGTVLINRAWTDASAFSELERVDVHPDEPFAANVLSVGDRLLYPSCFPKTLARIKQLGFEIQTVDNSELLKAEAGLTCMSILFE